jgi:hypothetical protein
LGPPAAPLVAFRQAHPPARLPVDGATWEYLSTGHGDPALLFLHGMAGLLTSGGSRSGRCRVGSGSSA